MDLKHTTDLSLVATDTCTSFPPSKSSDLIKPKDPNMNVEAQAQGMFIVCDLTNHFIVCV